jgi:hypothetical protein
LLREELDQLIKQGKEITLKKQKGFIFRYFMAKYDEVYGTSYKPGNRMKDFGQIGHILSDYEMMETDNFFTVIDYYVEGYRGRWDKGRFKTPSVVFLKYVISEIVTELAELEKKDETDIDEYWI